MTRLKTILVVDDDALLRLTLSMILKNAGYLVETASGGEEALEFLGKREFDLMFLDLNMPGMCGTELLVEVHRQNPRLPVLILTANATLDSAIQAVRLGARDYLVKPAEPGSILARIADILAEAEQPDRKREIVGQVQNLLAELQRIEGAEATPTNALAALPPTDANRFLQKGPFSLDLHARHATLNNQYLPITGIYFDYLVTLLRHAPKTVPNKTLVKESQGYDVVTAEARDLARWRIHELRKVIEPNPQDPQYILTVRGVGYRMVF
jgi:DNA-binding response OmpR family regulator